VIEVPKDSKGQLRVIEAVLATIIIFTTFASATYLLKSHRTWATRHSEELEKIAYNVMQRLAESGALEATVGDSHPGWELHLKLLLETVLPPSVYFNLTVLVSRYQLGTATLAAYNGEAITNGNSDSFAKSPEVASSTYIYTCEKAKIYVLVLQLATGGEIQ